MGVLPGLEATGKGGKAPFALVSHLKEGFTKVDWLMQDILVEACLEPRKSKGGSKPPVPVGKGLVGFLLARVGKPGVGVALGSRREG